MQDLAQPRPTMRLRDVLEFRIVEGNSLGRLVDAIAELQRRVSDLKATCFSQSTNIVGMILDSPKRRLYRGY